MPLRIIQTPVLGLLDPRALLTGFQTAGSSDGEPEDLSHLHSG